MSLGSMRHRSRNVHCRTASPLTNPHNVHNYGTRMLPRHSLVLSDALLELPRMSARVTWIRLSGPPVSRQKSASSCYCPSIFLLLLKSMIAPECRAALDRAPPHSMADRAATSDVILHPLCLAVGSICRILCGLFALNLFALGRSLCPKFLDFR